MLFAFTARAVNLGGEPLWIDETFSLWLAHEPVDKAVALASGDVHPPLYFVLLGPWARLTGDSELAGRYFSTLTGALAVALTFALGRRLFGVRAGLWAALALSVAGLHVRYSRELRMYALLALLSVASTYAYVRWQARPARKWALVYWALTAALPYTHYYGVFIPLAHTVHFGLIMRTGGLSPLSDEVRRRFGEGDSPNRPSGRTWLLMQVGVALAFVPWLSVMLRQAAMRPAGLHHAAPTDWPTLEWLLYMLADGQVWLIGGLIVWGILNTFVGRDGPRTRPYGRTILLLSWLIAPFIGAAALNLRLPSLTLRNLTLVTPAIALLVGVALSRLPRAPAVMAAGLVIYNALTVFPYLYPGNPPWRDFVHRVAAQVRPTDVMLYHLGQGARWEPFEYYRRREPAFPVEPISLFDLPGPPSSSAFAGALEALVRDEPRVWVVTSYETPISWYAFEALTRTHHLSAREALIDTNVYLFEPPPVQRSGYRLGDNLFLVRPMVRSRPPYQPGETFAVTVAWEVLRAPENDYSVGLHLVNEAYGLTAQSDAYPEPRTSLWRAGETRETIHRLALPADLPPGRYDVHLVVYTWWDQARLPVRDSGAGLPLGDYVLLDTITVE